MYSSHSFKKGRPQNPDEAILSNQNNQSYRNGAQQQNKEKLRDKSNETLASLATYFILSQTRVTHNTKIKSVLDEMIEVYPM